MIRKTLESFRTSAHAYGLLTVDRPDLCLSLLIAGVCQGDDVAMLQLQDLLAESKDDGFAEQAAKSITSTRRQWAQFSRAEKQAFRVECHKAGVWRYSRAQARKLQLV